MWNPFKRKEKNDTSILNDDLYNALFADDPDDFIQLKDHPAISWIYENRTPALAELELLAEDQSVESRIRFLALYTALQRGLKISRKVYLGTIMEVPMDRGYDVLAFYSDKRARYYNYSGKAVIYEGGRDAIDDSIEKANSVSIQVCNRIGPWDKKRLPKPNGNIWRFSFLVSDGLYFGQGPMNALNTDELAAAMIRSGAEVMKTLTNEAQKSA
jgi:hypothetical protein